MENAIVLKDVTKRYGDFCLDHLNLTIPQGCIVGLVGENGAGKTTILRAILQMMPLDEGKIQVLGREREQRTLDWKEELGGGPYGAGLLRGDERAADGKMYEGNIPAMGYEDVSQLSGEIPHRPEEKAAQIFQGNKSETKSGHSPFSSRPAAASGCKLV